MTTLKIRGRTVDAGVVRTVTGGLGGALLLLGAVIVSVAALAVGALLGLCALTVFLVQAEDRRHSGRGSA